MPEINNFKLLSIFYLATMSICLVGCGRTVERLEQIRDRVVRQAGPTDALLAAEALALGNPSHATADPANKDNFLLVRGRQALSYNNSRGTANWVAWKVTFPDLGNALPRPRFKPDPDLPAGFRRVLPNDYSGSGYDRGHMVASADRFSDPLMNEQTFYMTNIVPQSKDLNQFPWQKLESYTRTLVRKGYDVYVIAGVLGKKERLRKRVVVPAACWKILYIVPRGGLPSDSGAAQIVAVEMPNEEGIARDRWLKFKTTVRALEQKTGYDFFSVLPVAEQDRLETSID